MYHKKKPVVAFDVIDLAVGLDWTSGSGQVMLFRSACAQMKRKVFFCFCQKQQQWDDNWLLNMMQSQSKRSTF
jgi:hypothetical protein